MNEEEAWLREARLRGEPEPEELTFGELREAVELSREREKRFLQHLALIAYRQVWLTAKALAGETLPPLTEAFPFWDEAEIREARLAHYRGVMERHAAADRKERDHGAAEQRGHGTGKEAAG